MTDPASEEAWLAWRHAPVDGRASVTATDVARAHTGKYGGLYVVVAEQLGYLPPVEVTREMKRGKFLEPTLAAMVQLATDLHVVGEQTWCSADHAGRPDHKATPDGFVAEHPDQPLTEIDTVLELKTYGEDIQPPWDYYRCQVQWQLYVTGLHRALLVTAAVNDDTLQISDFRLHWIEADELTQMMLMDVAEVIASHIDTQTLPDPDGSDHATEAVRAVTHIAVPNADMIDLTGLETILDRRAQLKPAIKTAEVELAEIDNLLRSKMGTAGHGTAEGWTVTYSKARNVFDPASALVALPQFAIPAFDRDAAEDALGKKALDPFKIPTGARTLTVKPAKENQ